jgi:hypothetical protein
MQWWKLESMMAMVNIFGGNGQEHIKVLPAKYFSKDELIKHL